MTTNRIYSLLVVAVLVSGATAQDELEQRATWEPPAAKEVKASLDTWLAAQELDELTKIKVEALWPAEGEAPSGNELLEQVTTTVAMVDKEAEVIVKMCRGERTKLVLPEFAILEDEEVPGVVRHNLQLLYGKWLADQRMFNESLEVLADLKPEEVADPAALLFYQSVGNHRLLNKEQCLTLVTKLLENDEVLPKRYETVARQMEADLKPLKTDSLDEISRIMRNIEGRLDLGRAGKRVRKEEEDVVAKLEKLIEEKEKQQQQGGGGGGAGGSPKGSNQPSSPMQDSIGGNNKGPGNVDPKRIGSASGWGNLPARERQEALQQLSRDYPAHYREVIEEYFKKLAKDGVAE